MLALPVARAVGDDDLEGGAQLVRCHPFRPHIGLRREPVGDDAPIRQARDHLLHRRMVDAQHGKAVERNVGDELVVAGDHRLGACPNGPDAPASMLVTTAITAGRRRKLPSLSSASTTIQSPAPSRVLVP